MSSFQRMVVIPQEEYQTLTNLQNIKNPLVQHYSDLEQRYAVEEAEKDPFRRLVLQSDTLNQMKHVKDQIRDSLTSTTPKPYASRAKALLDTIDHFLKYNDKGEIYKDDGHVVPGSRLEDLIQHAVRDRRRNMTPTGWADFLKLLNDHNVPKSILNIYTLDEMEKAKQNNTAPAVAEPERRTPVRVQPPRPQKPRLEQFREKDFAFLKKYKE